ncbi:MAG: hypothetical protein A2Z95_04200 [Gallionellales bacterium GWA2_60_18]|nr:MAG: hypothetical protein A2Z95_04200 [Gallionellales bacterium GWA2_60_18]
MSLLLDARKKLQQAQSMREGGHSSQTPELALQEHPAEQNARPAVADPALPGGLSARSAGQNLFSVKAPLASPARALPNRNLLLALGGTILLLGFGAAWLWYLDSASSTGPLRPVHPPSTPIAQQPAAAPAAQQAALVSGIAETQPAAAETAAPPAPATTPPSNAIREVAAAPAPDTATAMAQPPVDSTARASSTPIRIQQQRAELIDPLLRDAYIAYREGRLDDAQQKYLAMFKKDAQNSDALLGLATLAQHRGEDRMAAQYYALVLALDPRNALANAGMSSLSADVENNESRLKILLREQGNSAPLHFALGNLYAGQSRWGEAQQAYFNAYTLEAGNAEYAFNLAVSLDRLGQGQLAAQHYQRALQLDPSRTAGFDHMQISRRVQELTRPQTTD